MPIIKNLSEHKKLIFFSIAIGWTLFLTVLSLFSSDSLPELSFSFTNADKIIHIMFYLVLTLVWNFYFYFKSDSILKIALQLKIGLVVFFYGIIIEVLQEVLPFGRSADWKDIIANMIGILIATSLARWILNKNNELKRKN